MSGRIKIKPKNKDKKPKIDVFKVIEGRFKNMNELRDLIDMDPRKGLVRIREGAGLREVERGGCLHRNYLNMLEEELGAKLSIDLIDKYIKRKVIIYQFIPVYFDASQPRPTPATPRPLPGSPPVTYFIGLEDSVFLTQIFLYS